VCTHVRRICSGGKLQEKGTMPRRWRKCGNKQKAADERGVEGELRRMSCTGGMDVAHNE
jgi:hypothetical protein